MDKNIATFLLLGLLALGWTLNPFFKKKAIGDLNSYQYLFINTMIVSIFIVLLFLHRILNGKDTLSFITNQINKNQLLWLLCGGIITFTTSLLLIILIQQHDVSYIIPHIQPLVIVLTILFGFFLFKEEIDRNQVIGIILVIMGLIVINYKHIKKQ